MAREDRWMACREGNSISDYLSEGMEEEKYTDRTGLK
jgi:hypothetical protein